MCRCAGAVPGTLSLVLLRFRPKAGSRSKISGRLLKVFRALSGKPSHVAGKHRITLISGSRAWAEAGNSRGRLGGARFQRLPRATAPSRTLFPGSFLCYAIAFPVWKSAFRAAFRSDSSRENIKIGLPGRPSLSRLEAGRILARKLDFWTGGTIA